MHSILYWLASALAIEDGYAAPYVREHLRPLTI